MLLASFIHSDFECVTTNCSDTGQMSFSVVKKKGTKTLVLQVYLWGSMGSGALEMER